MKRLLSDEKFRSGRNSVMCKHKFNFSSNEYQRYLQLCPFSEEELKILELRRKGKSVIEICFALNLSERTVARRFDSIMQKIKKEI